MKATAEEEGLLINKNHEKAVVEPKRAPGKLSDADFAKLMRKAANVKKTTKSANFKELNKANSRRFDKYEREKVKVQNARAMEQAEKDRIEWAITDKGDEKYQKKMAAKQASQMNNGPSEKEMKNSAYLEEEEAMASKKSGKNGWGKKK